jgi:hypothetical protein
LLRSLKGRNVLRAGVAYYLLLNTYWPWRRGSSESGSMVDGPNSGNRPPLLIAFLLVKLFECVADMHCILTFGCLEGEHQSRSYCGWSNTSPLGRHPTPVKSRQESKDVQAIQLDEHGNKDIELRQPWHVRLLPSYMGTRLTPRSASCHKGSSVAQFMDT